MKKRGTNMITENQYKVFRRLVSLTQKELKEDVSKTLRKYYQEVEETEDYIYAKGDIDIALLAHLDTVHVTPVEQLFFDKQQSVVWSPEGLGADDRAGVFAIMLLAITEPVKPHIIFTTNEELGGLGAQELAKIECPFPNLKYIIQLDRRGKNDCVFYSCNNEDFMQYIESFGFVTNIGTYSDISFICPKWKVAGVNLSVGYENEHTLAEYLDFHVLMKTIQKVRNMLAAAHEAPRFDYIEEEYKCCMCMQVFPESKLHWIHNANQTVFPLCDTCYVSLGGKKK